LKKYTQLSQEERYTIAELSRRRYSDSEIARAIGRHRSTIGRERKRNPNTHDGVYRAQVAHSYATARRRRNRRGTHFSKTQWSLVCYYIQKKWSPEQISDHLKTHTSFSISHETIYQYILKDKKRGGSLYTHMRIMPKQRRKRYNQRDSRGILPGKRHISTRPKEVQDRKVPGHWEGDTVIGSDRFHCILTLVERRSGFVIIKKLASRTASLVTAATLEALKEHSKRFKTITFDNGTEFHDYASIEAQHPVICYFATPYHSWERGTNENTNGLIRQYLKKGHSMEDVTQADCDLIAHELNTRPRKRHGYLTPRKVYYSKV
jgi:IS30 family transposase